MFMKIVPSEEKTIYHHCELADEKKNSSEIFGECDLTQCDSLYVKYIELCIFVARVHAHSICTI